MSQKIDLQGLLSAIKLRSLERAHIMVALSGFGGAGKSTVANKIQEQLEDGRRKSRNHKNSQFKI